MAVEKENVEIVKLLLQCSNIDVNLENINTNIFTKFSKNILM